jgi:hypothetical protein
MTCRKVRIAVCGHRRLDKIDQLETGIQVAGRKIKDIFGNAEYQVFSCLAEGADRLLADRLIELLGADLIAVLPFPDSDYLDDFNTVESVQEFLIYKKRAKMIISPQQTMLRPLAYQRANQTLLNHCNILVAVWDGRPARGIGGTAETVEFARKLCLPILWIHASEDPLAGILLEEENIS